MFQWFQFPQDMLELMDAWNKYKVAEAEFTKLFNDFCKKYNPTLG